jgi:ribosomal protein L37E
VCTACGFVRLHNFCWIGENVNVNVVWLSFFAFCAVTVHVVFYCIVVSECKCKQCGFVRQKMSNASTSRKY